MCIESGSWGGVLVVKIRRKLEVCGLKQVQFVPSILQYLSPKIQKHIWQVSIVQFTLVLQKLSR